MRTLPVLLLLGAMLAACAGDPSGTGGSVPASQPVDLDHSTAPTSSDAGERTPVPPTLPPDPGYRDRLGQYADFVLADALVPRGSPEHLHYVESCVESAGFSVTVEHQAISANPPPEQAAYFQEVLAHCEAAAVSSGLVAQIDEPSEAELAAWYAAFTITYQCLVDHGYPTSAPPSEDSYIEAGGRNWHPYDTIRDIAAAEAECPQDLLILFERLASGS